MAVKLMHYWTINPSSKEAYADFIIKQFIPGVNRLGMHTVAGWSVLVGSYSEIIMETVSSDLNMLETALKTRDYRLLKSDLLNLVTDYKTKVMMPIAKRGSYSMSISPDTVKFNQMWDVITLKPEDYQSYEQFVTHEFYPLLEKIGVHVAGEWEVLIGDEPHTFCEGRVTDAGSLIPALQNSEFRRTRKKLKQYVENYQSRILSFHVRKIKGARSESYEIIPL
ncbi:MULTISPECIES: hypothetical protein [Desulfotignum]|jgi:hypothetical protein|uniref:NIPSNAP domain-containing protein n=1 Tax=Desulfotignum phosphitoxidans DSM 13687 TaxID=1286635 RepID=S0G3Q8_9BACT|nr:MULTISPECIES: hypothetical protein [Desulfotignum]EMS78882.1 hypothetical protein Dpo_6c00810 [Desulfotignum phosphitoxidans DSM 13687]